MAERKTILVTGYPGFLARWLLRKWLQTDDNVEVYLLVEHAARDQAEQALDRLSRLSSSPDFRQRVHLLPGDVTSIDLGLAGPDIRNLTAKVDELYHLAAAHSVSGERRHAEAVNIHGTANVLALARAMSRLSRLVHFSSAYVSGRRTGIIMEDELEQAQTFRNAYEETKYQAEVLMRRASDKLPITIIRPAGVVGDSQTGEIDRFDSVYHIGMLLVGSPIAIPIPQAGEGSAPLNLVPVDYVVDAVHAIVSDPNSIGKTFHVVDPNPLPVRRVYEIIAVRAGKKLPKYSVPVNVTKALLRIPGLERFAAVSHEAIDYLNNMAFYNCRNTLAALDGTGLRCPHFEEYVDVLMRYVRDYFEQAGQWSEVDAPDLKARR